MFVYCQLEPDSFLKEPFRVRFIKRGDVEMNPVLASVSPTTLTTLNENLVRPPSFPYGFHDNLDTFVCVLEDVLPPEMDDDII